MNSLLLLLAAQTVFVDVRAAERLIREDHATVIDARGDRATPPFIAGAQPIEWLDLRDGLFRTGKLGRPEALKSAIEAAGVDSGRPVLVYGWMHEGWGEEGRIWWMLTYLGHPKVRILDGGIQGWVQQGKEVVSELSSNVRPGQFELALRPKLRAELPDVQSHRLRQDAQIIDARTTEEFNGKTPYMSFRGGHIPKAKSMYWLKFMDKQGRVLPRAVLRQRLLGIGLDPEKPTIAYCTGGLRSAFVVAVLRELGFEAANYDGSWWEYSAEVTRRGPTAPKP